MFTSLLSSVSQFIVHTISSMGYGGVALLMAIESANIPLPSEVIMPFAGYLASTGRFALTSVALFGGLGCLIGSIFSYYLGYFGGRPLVERFGKYVLLSKHDLDTGDRWFARFGPEVAFVGRLLPVVRTFISFPAGIGKVNIWKFLLYTFVGSVIWSYFLGYIGLKLGQNWESLKVYFHGLDFVIVGLIVIGLAWWIRRHVKQSKSQ